jgi:catechol 2,3-dioxygenase-like lactoylglutathione lyase family enzyme
MNMALKSLFPVFLTSNPAEARDFYVQHFGFRVVFEADWYVQLHGCRGDGSPPLELAFMLPDLADQPAALHAAFSGSGVILTIEVDDAEAMHAKLHEAGALRDAIVTLRDEPWGQRHFLFRDPTGTLLDVVQQIPPAPEYVATYSPPEARGHG